VGFTIVGRATGTPHIDGREIVEARFCAVDALPDPVGDHLQGQLTRWISQYRARQIPRR
jgi:hypothetical protein